MQSQDFPWVEPLVRHAVTLPLVTSELPGIGGSIKKSPGDFEVEEVPAYLPSGTGDHLFLWLQKSGVAGEELIAHVARALGIPRSDVGVAGLKDKEAVTRQYVSVPGTVRARLNLIETPQIQLLGCTPHGNKLRTGHLKGNRFRIVVRDAAPQALERCGAIRATLLRSGLPNFFGTQRFGRDGDTARLGLRLIGGGPGVRGGRKFLYKLAVSAAQSAIFNYYLKSRICQGAMHAVLDGDVMLKRTGGIFFVTDREVEQGRFDRRETVHAGPLFGRKMFPAREAALELERQILRELGLTAEQFRGHRPLLAGTRRPNLVWLDTLAIAPSGDDLEFRFELPAGSYATQVMAEFVRQ